MISNKVILNKLSVIRQIMNDHGDKYTIKNYMSMIDSLISDIRRNLTIPSDVKSYINNILTSPVKGFTQYSIDDRLGHVGYIIYNGSVLINSVDIKLLSESQLKAYDLLKDNNHTLMELYCNLRCRLSWTPVNLPNVSELEIQLKNLYNFTNIFEFEYQFKGADYYVLSPNSEENTKFNGMYLHNLLRIYDGLGLSYKTYLSNEPESHSKLMIESDDQSLYSILAPKS